MRLSFQHGFGRFVDECYADWMPACSPTGMRIYSKSRNIVSITLDPENNFHWFVKFKYPIFGDITRLKNTVGSKVFELMLWFDVCSFNQQGLYTWNDAQLSGEVPSKTIEIYTYRWSADPETYAAEISPGPTRICMRGGWALSSDIQYRIPPEQNLEVLRAKRAIVPDRLDANAKINLAKLKSLTAKPAAK